jgi:hypothetical protein
MVFRIFNVLILLSLWVVTTVCADKIHNRNNRVENLVNELVAIPTQRLVHAGNDQTIHQVSLDNLAVVIPFIKRLIPNVVRMLDNTVQPCDSSRGDLRIHRHLYLYYDKGDDTSVRGRTQMIAAFESSKWIQTCFLEVNMIYARLTAAETIYPNGPGRMLQRLFEPRMLSGIDAFFLWEWDAWPLRDNWLDRLYLDEYRGKDFWMRGGICQWHLHNNQNACKKVVPSGCAKFMNHINGNAIYKLGDTMFKEHYIDRMLNYGLAFDLVLPLMVLRDLEINHELYKLAATKFQYSDFMQDYGVIDTLPPKKLLIEHPTALLVHNRKLAEFTNPVNYFKTP